MLTLDDGYTGTVTLAGSTTITEFGMTSGAVVVPGNLSVYVANVFGGTLDVQGDASIALMYHEGGTVWIDGEATLDQMTMYDNDCYFTMASGGTAGYLAVNSGLLTLGESVTAGVFTLSGGAVAQAAGADLTIDGGWEGEWSGYEFAWTGGTLNSTANLQTVNIIGITGLLAPVNAGTVSLGSHLTLENGAVVTMKEGDVTLFNDGITFTIKTNCELIADPGQNKPIDFAGPIAFGNPMHIKNGGWFKVLTGFYNAENGSVLNEGGSFILESNTVANFGKEVPGMPPQVASSFWQKYGNLYFAADGMLLLEEGMLMDGGAIVQKSGTKPPLFLGNLGVPTSKLLMRNGHVLFENMAGVGGYEFGEFIVTGDVDWRGGMFHPFVSSFSSDLRDRWMVYGQFDINVGLNPSATLQPNAVDLTGIGDIPLPGMTWEILSATTMSATPPSYDSITWALDSVGNPQRAWNLRKR